jgi:TolB-like protein/Tfp pilus assembly protein PilF
MTEPSHAVFLSYASQDGEAAQRICEALRAAGVEVWFDQSELRGGDAWDQSIRKQIKTCALFVPIVSKNTHARAEGYFRLEWKLAVDRSHLIMANKAFLLPVVIDDSPNDDENVPDKFREVQWTRLPAGETPPEFAARIARLLTPESTATSARQPANPLSATASVTPLPIWTRRSRLAGLAVVTVLACAALYLVIERPRVFKHATIPQPRTYPGAVPSTTAAVIEKSIAVLPFVDMSEQHDQEYFGDGMAEEVLDLLGKLPGLTVVARTSSFQFKRTNEDVRAIASKLGVRNVVEGSVRRSGSRVRVTAQLIDAQSGTQRWSETYDREYEDVLLLQSQIASEIARELQIATGAGDAGATARLQNAEAYTLYLRGRSALDRGDRARLAQAQRYFEQAIALDPSWPQPAEALAWTHVMQIQYQLIPSRSGWKQARQAAERALAINSTSAAAHAVLGLVHALEEFNWDAADSELSLALQSDPNNTDTLLLSANVLLARGQLQNAIQRVDAALAIDPLNPELVESHALFMYYSGDLAAAESEIRRCLAISPTYDYARFLLGQVLLARGERDAALRETQQETLDGGRDLGFAVIYRALRNEAESDAAIVRLARQRGELWPYAVAQAHAYRAERKQALDWLDKAYEARDSDLQFVLNDPLLESVRGDSRFNDLLRRMHLPR